MGDHADIDHSGLTGVGDVAAHEADTTAVHGITNTANLYAAGGTDVAVADGGTGASTAAAARTALGVVIGTDVQAFDADIPTVAASQAEMEAGTEAALRSVSPLRVAQAIAALGGTPADILDIPTAETDDTLVLAPDGAGGVEFRAETGGGGGGALVLLEQYTASASATLDFTTFISSTYDDYEFRGTYLICSDNGQHLYAQAGTGGGPTYDSGANYYSPSNVIAYRIATAVSNAAGYGQVSFSVRLIDPQNTAQNKQLMGLATWHDGSNVVMPTGSGGLWAATTAITAIRFLFSTGNIASGTIRVYGIAK